jgi:two-component system, NtrC family, sensor histidine kinase PilS
LVDRVLTREKGTGAGAEQRVAPYILFRLVLAFALLGLAAVLLLRRDEALVDVGLVSRLGVLAFVFMGLSAALTPRLGGLLLFRWIQVLFDMGLFTVLIAITGGPQSPFFTLYFLNIAGALWLLPAGGAVAVAIGDVVLFAAITASGSLGVLPIGAPQGVANLYSEVLLRVFALLLVALLSTQLAASLRRQIAAQELEARRLGSEQDAVLTQVPAAVLIFDASGQLQRMNQLGLELFGEVFGVSLEELLSPEGDRWEQSVIALQGERRVLCGRKRIDRGEQVVIVEDVTWLRQMEVERQRDERLAAVGRLAAGLAHEIRNPLASLSGAVQLMGVQPGDPLQDIALREVRRLSALVDDFLDASSELRLDPSEVDPGAVVDEVVSIFRRDARFQGRVKLVVEPGLSGVLWADPRRLRQVLWNLLINGAQAIASDGTVTVSWLFRDGMWILRVADSGVGIKEADLGRVFDPFFTTRVGGTGLGLAAVYRIVAAHRGSVSVESKAQLGTVFTVVLPAGSPTGHPGGDDGR